MDPLDQATSILITGSTMSGASLPENGIRAGFRNFAFLKNFRQWTKSPKKGRLCQRVIGHRQSPTMLNIYLGMWRQSTERRISTKDIYAQTLCVWCLLRNNDSWKLENNGTEVKFPGRCSAHYFSKEYVLLHVTSQGLAKPRYASVTLIILTPRNTTI